MKIRFRLPTLFWVALAIALVCGWYVDVRQLRWEASVQRQQSLDAINLMAEK
jgi:hypothetical protein